MKSHLIVVALAAAGLVSCGTENATESRVRVPPQPILASAGLPQQSVSQKYPAPKSEANLGEQEPLDPTEQEKR
jgi:hypothetical protein